MKGKVKLNKKQIAIGLIIFTILIALISSILFINYKKRNSYIGEIARSMAYPQVQEGEEKIEGTESITFDAFFLRDLDGDGYAEKLRGSARSIGGEDTIYMELNVLSEGHLEDGIIEINSDNFYFQTALPRDNEIKENAIGSNIKQIKLNTINNGTQKMITGMMRSGDYAQGSTKTAAIGNDINKYSKINSITLRGTQVETVIDRDGNKTEKRIPIEKTVSFNVDWHGTTKSEIPNILANKQNLTQSQKLETAIDEENNEFKTEFNIGIQETKSDLILSKAHIETEVPELSGYAPIKVEVVGTNVTYTYDSETRKLVAEKEAVLNENGVIKSQAYDGTYGTARYNKFKVIITYPLEAYQKLGESDVFQEMLVNGYYEGFNNANEEFVNPYKSNVSTGNFTLHISNPPQGTAARFDIYVGKLIYSPTRRYVVSKENMLKIYNEISDTSVNDTYIVNWSASTGETGNSTGLLLQENGSVDGQIVDEFIKRDGSSISMESITSNIGIYFANPRSMLGDDGWIKVFDVETDELLETFNKDNWSKYTSSKPYKYERPVKHIRIETSSTNINASLNIYNIKSLDTEYVTENFTREEFDELTQIKSTLNGYLGGTYINTSIARATYEAPYAKTDMQISQSTLSTQETKENMQITIKAEGDEASNQVMWLNGVFLLKLPKEILNLEINSVLSSDEKVKIISYEYYEESGDKFVKINTENSKPTKFDIVIDCNMTPDPRMATKTDSIILYSYNENASDYWSSDKDIYDINGNLNVEEKIGKISKNISFVSPNLILTNETVTDYDTKGSVVISPQIAILSKEQRTANINIEIKNNYLGPTSDVIILGRVPFDNNKYVISGKEMGSNFTVSMQNEISMTEALIDKAKVYYSENGDATKDLSDSNNGWTQTPSDFSKVKSYLIDLTSHVFERNETAQFSYTIRIPEGLSYNQISYSHHAMYFSLNTPEGKYRTQLEPDKIGLMIGKEYNLEVIKYQTGTSKLVGGATYSIIEDGQAEGKTRVTCVDGKLVLNNLYVDRTYVIKEIKSPASYELSSGEIKFKTSEENGELKATVIDGNARGIRALQPDEENGYRVQVDVEDEVKPSIKIIKTEKGSDAKLRGIRFKITGEGLPENGKILTTNLEGEVNLSGLHIGTQYILEEVKANGYYLENPIKFMISNTLGIYSVSIIDGEVKNKEVVEIDNIPTGILEIENTKIPLYNLQINKVIKGESNPLAGAKFRLFKGTEKIDDFVTDENGIITINNLYQYDSTRDLDQTYTLKEIFAPEGFSAVKDITFRVENLDSTLTMEVFEGNIKDQTANENTLVVTIEDSPSFKLIKKDGETGEVLPGTKFAIYNVDDGTEQLALDSKNNILGTKEIIDGKEYYTLTTNENGEISANLREGLYKAVEVKASSDKYELTNNAYYFGIGATREALQEIQYDLYDQIGGTGNDTIKCMDKTLDGGMIVGGHFENTIILKNGDKVISNGSQDVIIIKYDKEGEIEWYKQIGGTAQDCLGSMIVTKDGGLAVGFGAAGSFTLENGDKITNGADNLILMKYDKDGNIQWYNRIHCTSTPRYDLNINAMCETINEEIVIGIRFWFGLGLGPSSGVGNDTCIAKYSKDGKLQWYKHQANENANNNNIYSMIGTSDGGIVYTKACEQKEFIDSDIIEVSNGGTDGYIVKLSSEGNVEWYKKIGGTGDDGIYTVIETEDKKIIAGGNFKNSIILENGETITSRGDGDSILLIYSSDGKFESYKQIGGIKGDEIKTISRTKDGGIIVGGLFRDRLMPEMPEIYTNNQDGYILKYDKDKKLEWGQQISGNTNEIVNSLVELDNGEILALTEFNNNINLSTGKSITTKGGSDAAILKLNWKEVPDVVTKKVTTIGSSAEDLIEAITATSDGGTVIGIKAEDIIILENGYTTKSKNSLLVVKYNSNGEIEWIDESNRSGRNGYIYAICETVDKGIVVGISTFGEMQLSNGEILKPRYLSTALIKYSENGNLEWYKYDKNSFSLPNVIYSIEATNDGGFICVKTSDGEVQIGEEIITTQNDDGIIEKYDKNGNLEWYKKIGGENDKRIQSIIETKDGGFLTAVCFEGEITLENGKTLKCNGTKDILLLKYSKEGKLEKYKQIEEYAFRIIGIVETQTGGLILGANNGIIGVDSNWNIEWNASPIKDIKALKETSDGKILVSGISDNKGIIAKCNSNGDLEWKKEIGKSINDVIERNDKTIVAVGEFQNSITLENGEQITSKGSTDGLIVNLQEKMGIPDVQEIVVENTRKEFKITTAVNQIDGVKGGKISGENANPYEIVKYGDSNTKEIILTPDVSYEIINITINGEEHQFTANEDGTYSMPTFENITENKHIVVTYSLKQNKIIINKIDGYTKESLTGAEFRLDQIEERTNPKDVIGNLTDNSNDFCDTEISEGIGELTNNGEYYFVKNAEGKIVPTNSKTWQTANVEGATEGIHNSTAHSYIPIDLTGKTGKYFARVNATASSQYSADWGYATITETTTAPEYNNTNGRFMYTDGSRAATDFTSQALEGGKMYYSHLGYYKNSNTDGNTDQIIINSIKLYSGTTYNFTEENGEYKSINQGKANTTSNSYIPIDLSEYTGKYNLHLKAKVSSANGDYGYVTINQAETAPAYNNTSGRLVYINGNSGDVTNYKEYTTVLQGGNKYYLHLGYYKNGSGDAGEDVFSVKDIEITLNDSELYHVNVETNSEGQAITQIPFGKYVLTEIRTPEGYEEQKGQVILEFRPDGTRNVIENTEEVKDENGNSIKAPKVTVNENGEFVVENISTAKVIVEHYIKGTEEKLAEDVIIEGKQGDTYTTVPLLDLEKYELEKDSNGEFILPENASGIFTQEDIIVKYYYVEKQIPLTVHHYIENTTNNVPLENGSFAEDERYFGDNGTNYITNPISNDVLSREYELVELPNNKDGVYSGEEVIVTYYYKKVERNIVIQKSELIKEINEETGEEIENELLLSGAKFKIEKDGMQDDTEYTTSANGKINVTLEVGRYIVTETQAPEGYKLPSNPTTIVDVSRDTENGTVVKILNQKLKETVVIVKHYLIDRDGNKTTIEISDSEIIRGKEGESYKANPVTNINKYELSESPSNESGVFTEENQEVIYYYVEKKTTLTVHHYIEGTTTKITLKDGTIAEDEERIVYVEENYETSQIENDRLPDDYELVEIPNNATGIVTNTPITVTYYYKKVQRNLNILKYDEDGTTPLQGVAFTVNNADESKIKQIRTEPIQNNGSYYFTEENGKYISNNKGKRNTTANSYIKIDLTDVERATIVVNAEVSSYNALFADYGYATITETTSAPAHDNTSGRFIHIAGKVSAKDYTTELQGGKVYYLHFGYNKPRTGINGNNDIFTINSVKIDGRDYLDYTKTISTEYITDANGKITLPLEYGEYNITEVRTVEGFKLPENPTQKISITKDIEEENINLEIINERIKGKVLVHHYIMNFDGSLTTRPVQIKDGDVVKEAQTEELEGNLNESYTTKPLENLLEGWKHVKTEGEVTGTYKGDTTIEVTYYYQEQIDVSETIDIDVTKIWRDNEIQSLRRPNTIKFVVTPYEEQAEEGVVANEILISEDTNLKNIEESQIEDSQEDVDIQKEIADALVPESTNNEESDISNKAQEVLKESNENELINTVKEDLTITEENKVSDNIIETKENEENQNKDSENSISEETVIDENIQESEVIEEKIITEEEITTETNTMNLSGEELNYYVFEFPNQVVNRDENITVYTLYGLLKYDNKTGRKIRYIVTEVEENEGDLKFYEPSGGIVTEETDEEGNIKYKAEIINTFKLPDNNVKDIRVTKIWKDNENKASLRPSSLILDLIGRVENVDINRKEENISSGENWQHTFVQNPIYNENGQEIEYSIEEKSADPTLLNKYISEITSINANNEITVTNNLIIQDSKIEKKGPDEITSLESKVPYSIDYTFELDKKYENDTQIEIVDTLEYEIVKETAKLAGGIFEENSKTIRWSGTYKPNENIVIWNNDVQDNVKVEITENPERNVRVINIHIDLEITYKGLQINCEKIANTVTGKITLANNVMDIKEVVCETPTRWVKDVIVNKLWKFDTEETRPDSITVHLKQVVEDENGNKKIVDFEDFKATIVPNPDGNKEWTHTWKDLPRYDGNGNEMNYTVEETEINYTKDTQIVENQYYCEKTEEVKDGNTVVTLINYRYGTITVTKVDSRKEEVKLPGAEFKLEKMIKQGDEWIVPDQESREYVKYVGTTGEDGTYTFKDLEYGYYKLTETKAPEEYRINKIIENPIEVNKSDEEHLNVQVIVKNDKKYSLPTTGGLGIDIIRNAGILIASIFAILLTNRKKIVPVKRTKIIEKPIRRKTAKLVRRKNTK